MGIRYKMEFILARLCFTILLHFGFYFVLFAQQNNEAAVLRFEQDSVLLLDLIKGLDQFAEIECVYSLNTIDEKKSIYLSKADFTSVEIIQLLRKQGDLIIKEKGKRLLILGNYSTHKESEERVLSGLVLDALSREFLTGASVFLSNRTTGTFTDNSGFFRLVLPDDLPDSIGLEIAYVGHEVLFLDLDRKESIQSEFFLFPNSKMQEITISGRLIDAFTLSDSVELKSFSGNRFLPGSLGANDVFQELAMLPGVNRGHDFQPGLSIRGLRAANTQYLVDEIPIYQPNHLFGLFSAVDQSSLQQIELYKDHTPMHLTGRLSGVINQQLKSGNSLQHIRKIGISNEAAILQLEGPVIWNKSSYAIGIRKSLVDYYLPQLLSRWTSFQDSELSFYDMNAKLTHRINARNTLELMGFISNDQHLFQQEAVENTQTNRLAWSSQILSAKWKGILGDRLVSSSQIAWTSYRSDKQYLQQANAQGPDTYYFYQIAQSNIRDFIFRQHNSYYLSNHWQLDAGVQLSRKDVNPVIFKSLFLQEEFEAPQLESNSDSLSWDIDAFISGEWKLQDRMLLETGFNLNYFYADRSASFVGINPLILAEFRLNTESKIKSILQRTQQTLHLLNPQDIGIASDLWLPSSKELPPEEMWQWTMEYIKNVKSWAGLNLSIYFRKMDHLIEYAQLTDRYDPSFSDGTVIPVFYNPGNLVDRLETISGLGWGVECSFDGQWKRLSYGLSYAYGHTHLSNQEGESYPSDHDFTHSGHFFVQYVFEPHWTVFTNGYFHSGGPYTLPLDAYKNDEEEWIFAFTQKNAQRFASFQSISLGSKYRQELYRGFRIELDFGIRNTLNHSNPVFVYLSEENEHLEVRQTNGLPVYPYVKMMVQF